MKFNNINNKKLMIIGRGPSSRFHSNFSKNDFYKIGYHYKNVDFEINFDRKIQDEVLSKMPGYVPLKVGGVEFHLQTLIHFLYKNNKSKGEIYLIGFDFNSNNEDDDIKKKSSVSNLQRKIDIDSQLIAYRRIKNNYHNLNIIRIGFDQYCDISPQNNKQANLAPSQVEIVAEITTNHFGETDRLEKLIYGAANAGADSVKLQKRDIYTLYDKKKLMKPYRSPFGKTFYDYRNALELTDEQINIAKEICKKLNIKLFFSVLDIKSFNYIIDFGFDRVKLPSTISNNIKLINYVAENFKQEVVISTGMTDVNYEKMIIEKFKNIKSLYLLQCISSYPTFYSNSNIAVVKHYYNLSKKHSNIIPGYSSHDINSMGSCLAVSAGAKMIEKHIKYGINKWAHFDDTALDVETGFIDFCEDIRAAERYLGSEIKRAYDFEHHKYNN